MSSSDDPMPVVMVHAGGSTANTTATNMISTSALGQNVGFLTHPKLTPGGSYAYTHLGTLGPAHASGSPSLGFYYSENNWNNNSQLGSGTTPLFLGTSVVKLPVSTSSNTQTASSRGGRRGYLKGFRTTGNIISGNQDDKYDIGGAEYRSVYNLNGSGGIPGSVIAVLP
jgi:hypothetical protein